MMNLAIENVAGIRSGEAEVHDGVNVVKAENWQGKSSFMSAIGVVMGTTGWSDAGHPLTDGASEGRVRLETDEDVYETRLTRTNTGVQRDGTVYLEDEQDQLCAHLFAFLGENNPIREVVRNNGDLASVLTRPLDMENIDQQLADLKRERRSVTAELERAQDAAKQLPSVQRTITGLEDDIDQLQTKREELLEESDVGDDADGQDELSSKQAQKEQLTSQISTLRRKIERQEEKLAEKQAELEELSVPDEPELTTDIEQKQDRITELTANINLLEDLYRVNKRVVDENKASLVTDVERKISGDDIECWVCGEETSEETISDRLSAMNERLTELRSEKSTLEAEVDEIRTRRREIKDKRRQQQDLETEVGELEADLEENRSQLDRLEARLEEVTETLETLREEVEAANDELTDLESEIKYKRAELESKREELDRLEREAQQRDQLAEEEEDLTAEIESLRMRRKEKKRELAERFEQNMAEIIDTLEPGFGAARLEPKTDDEGQITDFDLIVAREGRETQISALSEGEVEILGIVTALAGYETFAVGDRVPLITLDGLTELSSSNYHTIVDYLMDKTDILVTSAYPEIDEFDGHIISPEAWDVVSNRQAPV